MRHDSLKDTAVADEVRQPVLSPLSLHAAPHATPVAETPELDYDPARLLDVLRTTMHLKNDAALARTLGLSPPVISKIRHQQIPVGPSTLLRMHEVTELSIAHLRELMGDRRRHFRIGAAPLQPEGSAGRR